MIKISGIQKISLVDYNSEVSTTIFLAGCNFRCPFCHNFEFVVNDNIESFDINETLDYLESRKKYLTGVCISGGEPTIYPDLKDFIIKIKSMGYKIKLDTNGTNPKMLKDLVESKLIDYVAVDFKNSFNKYSDTIGTNNINLDNVKETINYLLQDNIDYEFRTTLINEFHNIDSIKEMGEEIKGARRLFLQRFEMSINVPNKALHEVDKKDALEFKRILEEEYNIKTELRGY